MFGIALGREEEEEMTDATFDGLDVGSLERCAAVGIASPERV